ncbi:YitT family protein [Bacillus sp. 03113]|uniref:YczE/YyaS/YitT family protein n=1 Tax=Bacillus sp. 03113 TaxID=2578211 RepID=UPI001141137C|nr:hypothetical protein [Bacillus sp. 03113]
MKQRIAWLCLSILLNAFGNALTVKAALGSAPWTAAGLNIAHFFHITVGWALILLGTVVLLVDDLLRKRWNKKRDIFNFIYLLSFGYLIDVWLFIMQHMQINVFVIRLIVCVIGVLFIGAAVSIYLRVNLVLHPFDDLLKIFREQYFKGNVVLAQRIALGIPLSISLLIWLLTKSIVGVNIGTIITFLCMGYFIMFFDKWIRIKIREIHTTKI